MRTAFHRHILLIMVKIDKTAEKTHECCTRMYINTNILNIQNVNKKYIFIYFQKELVVKSHLFISSKLST